MRAGRNGGVTLQANFRRESSRWMAQLAGHPSIIHWVVFNEAWGQFNTREVGEGALCGEGGGCFK